MQQENEDKCLEDEAKEHKTESEVKIEIKQLMNGETIGQLQGMERAERNELLRKNQSK